MCRGYNVALVGAAHHVLGQTPWHRHPLQRKRPVARRASAPGHGDGAAALLGASCAGARGP